MSGGHGTGVNILIGADPNNGGPAGRRLGLGGESHDLQYEPLGERLRATVDGGGAGPERPTLVAYSNGKTYQYSALAAIMNQVKAGSTVINMSFAAADPATTDPAVPKIYRAFFERMSREHPEVLFVAAAGNYGHAGNGAQMYPGGFNLPNLMTIGNVNNDGTINDSSVTASNDFEVSIFAPGHQAVRGYNPDTGAVKNLYGGTSMAAPRSRPRPPCCVRWTRNSRPNRSSRSLRRLPSTRTAP